MQFLKLGAERVNTENNNEILCVWDGGFSLYTGITCNTHIYCTCCFSPFN